MNITGEATSFVFLVLLAIAALGLFAFLVNGLAVLVAPLVSKPKTFRVDRKSREIALLRPRNSHHIPKIIGEKNGKIVLKRLGVRTGWSLMGGVRTMMVVEEVRPADEAERRLYLENFPDSPAS